jgi:hypothetical protein
MDFINIKAFSSCRRFFFGTPIIISSNLLQSSSTYNFILFFCSRKNKKCAGKRRNGILEKNIGRNKTKNFRRHLFNPFQTEKAISKNKNFLNDPKRIHFFHLFLLLSFYLLFSIFFSGFLFMPFI